MSIIIVFWVITLQLTMNDIPCKNVIVIDFNVKHPFLGDYMVK